MNTSTTPVVPGRTREFRVGDVFGRSFEVFARRFVLFFGLSLVSFVPLYALTFVQVETAPVSALILGAAGVVLGLVCGMLASAAVTYGVVQELRGRSFTFAESLSVALRRFLPLLGVAFCIGLMGVIAMILFVIPIFFVICVYYVAPQACVVEQTGISASLSRSSALTKGHRWQIFGIVVVIFLVNAVVSYILGLIVPGSGTLATVVTGAWQAVTGAFNAVLAGVLYFQLRSVKEGFELDQIASVFD
jgi:hypothetical protein